MLRKAKWKGYVALVLGFFAGIITIWNWIILVEQATRGVFPDFWFGCLQVLRVASVGYFAFIAHRHLSNAPVAESRWQRMGWGKILLGAWISYSSIQQELHPIHHRYEMKPSNDAQAAGMDAARYVILPGLAIGLLGWGIGPAFRNGENSAAK
jgi:hypothetical protein